jgi:hypothetical protein
VDVDRAIERALEPGETIVWSDRPHGALRASLRTLRDEWWILLLVSPGIALGFLALVSVPSPFSFVPYAVPLALVFFLALALSRRVVLRLQDRYFATSKGRLFIFSYNELRCAPLPPPALIATDARSTDEHGDVLLGSSVRLRDVSYPLIAVETLRATCPPDG